MNLQILTPISSAPRSTYGSCPLLKVAINKMFVATISNQLFQTLPPRCDDLRRTPEFPNLSTASVKVAFIKVFVMSFLTKQFQTLLFQYDDPKHTSDPFQDTVSHGSELTGLKLPKISKRQKFMLFSKVQITSHAFHA